MRSTMKKILSGFLVVSMLITIWGGVAVKTKANEATTQYTLNGNTYQVMNTSGMTWSEAKSYCESLGGHLATITTESEQGLIYKMLSDIETDTLNSYWLGANRDTDGKFAWVTGEAFDYANWDRGQPDNYKSREDSLMIYWKRSAGKWNDCANDGTCPGDSFFGKEKIGMICEWEGNVDTKYNSPVSILSINSNTYAYFDSGMSWSMAETLCNNMGGHLVTITSEAEQKNVELLMASAKKNSYWMGAYKNAKGDFSWVTGEPFDYTNWAQSQPDSTTEDSLMLYINDNPYASNGFCEWNDLKFDTTCRDEEFFGSSNFGFICEWDTTTDKVSNDTNTTANLSEKSAAAISEKLIKNINKYSLNPINIIKYFSVEADNSKIVLNCAARYNLDTLYLAKVTEDALKVVACGNIKNNTYTDTVSKGTYVLLTDLPYKLTADKVTLAKGKSKKITIKNIFSDCKITYISSNKKIATVDKNGVIKGQNVGKTTITAKIAMGKDTTTLKVNVTVK